MHYTKRFAPLMWAALICLSTPKVLPQAMFEDLIYYRGSEGIKVLQFIPSQTSFGAPGQRIQITQNFDDRASKANFVSPDETSQVSLVLKVSAEKAGRWTLSIRQPVWALKTGTILVDGKPVEVGISNTGFLKIERVWGTSTVTVTFEKQLRREALPGDPSRFALLDGPIVLAALGSDEPELGAKAVVIPRYEHQYIEGRDWQSSHYSVRGSHGLVELRPLYESADEHYLVFFHTAE